VLAFSTISQLGYMFLALGVGAPTVAMFHLFNHAFFKCLLFLSAGSVHHSIHTFDMRYMGGLRKWMPITYITTVVAGLSLAGIFPLAGFWSKDEVLAVAWSGTHAASGAVSKLVFWLALVAAFMTAFYVFRLIMMTFHGEFRGGIDAVSFEERLPDEAHHHVHRHESPWTMTLPMVVLAVFAIGSGFVFNSVVDLGLIPAHWFSHFLQGHTLSFNFGVAAISTLLALSGITLALLTYGVKVLSFDEQRRVWRISRRVLIHRFYMDHLYETLIVRQALYRGVFLVSDWLDRRVVDATVDLVGWVGRHTGRVIAQLQTGQVQVYGVGVSMGLVVILMVFLMQS
jgi:NADH-quinone oxidoreductase subunit L